MEALGWVVVDVRDVREEASPNPEWLKVQGAGGGCQLKVHARLVPSRGGATNPAPVAVPDAATVPDAAVTVKQPYLQIGSGDTPYVIKVSLLSCKLPPGCPPNVWFSYTFLECLVQSDKFGERMQGCHDSFRVVGSGGVVGDLFREMGAFRVYLCAKDRLIASVVVKGGDLVGEKRWGFKEGKGKGVSSVAEQVRQAKSGWGEAAETSGAGVRWVSVKLFARSLTALDKRANSAAHCKHCHPVCSHQCACLLTPPSPRAGRLRLNSQGQCGAGRAR